MKCLTREPNAAKLFHACYSEKSPCYARYLVDNCHVFQSGLLLLFRTFAIRLRWKQVSSQMLTFFHQFLSLTCAWGYHYKQKGSSLHCVGNNNNKYMHWLYYTWPNSHDFDDEQCSRPPLWIFVSRLDLLILFKDFLGIFGKVWKCMKWTTSVYLANYIWFYF